MKKRSYRAQKVNEVRWEGVAVRVKDTEILSAMGIPPLRPARGRPRQP